MQYPDSNIEVQVGDYTDRKNGSGENNRTPGRTVGRMRRLMVIIRGGKNLTRKKVEQVFMLKGGRTCTKGNIQIIEKFLTIFWADVLCNSDVNPNLPYLLFHVLQPVRLFLVVVAR